MEYSVKDRASGRVVARFRGAGAVARVAELDTDLYEILDGWLELERDDAVTLADVRRERNRLLELHAWKVRADSPLSDDSRAAWMAYLCALQAITKDLADHADVTWPVEPDGWSYAP